MPLSTPILSMCLLILSVMASPAGSDPPVADPVAYLEARQRAAGWYEEGRYQEAEESYARLVEETPTNAGLWFVLARARHHQGKVEGAIDAYEHCLELGYRYEPWIAYQLARLHAEQEDLETTRHWLRRSLALGWGNRPGIAEDPAFAALRSDARFIELIGHAVEEPAGRVDGWNRDLDYLLDEAQRLHAAPDRPARDPRFGAAVESLRARVDELDDDQMVLQLSRLVTTLGDGHTGIYGPGPDSPLRLRSGSLPLRLYLFSDGLFVVDAVGDARRWIGSEVLRFGEVPAQRAIRALGPYVHHDNASTVRWLGVRYRLPSLSYLRAIAATKDPNTVELTLRTHDGTRTTETFEGGDHAHQFRRKLRPPESLQEVPLYLRQVDTNYWTRALPEHDALYFQFNQVRDSETRPSLATFADSLRTQLVRGGADYLIVDLRHNNGGNNSLVLPLLRVLVWWELDAPDHEIYVVTGRNTFSAAQNFLNRIERLTEAVIVGESSSSSPNFTGEETDLILPYSRVRGSISNRHWQDSDPGDERQHIAPHMPVSLSSDDYFEGRDPALEAILRWIRRG